MRGDTSTSMDTVNALARQHNQGGCWWHRTGTSLLSLQAVGKLLLHLRVPEWCFCPSPQAELRPQALLLAVGTPNTVDASIGVGLDLA